MLDRRQHKEQIATLQQQLKSASHSSKGGEKESDRVKKELDKTRQEASALSHCEWPSRLQSD